MKALIINELTSSRWDYPVPGYPTAGVAVLDAFGVPTEKWWIYAGIGYQWGFLALITGLGAAALRFLSPPSPRPIGACSWCCCYCSHSRACPCQGFLVWQVMMYSRALKVKRPIAAPLAVPEAEQKKALMRGVKSAIFRASLQLSASSGSAAQAHRVASTPYAGQVAPSAASGGFIRHAVVLYSSCHHWLVDGWRLLEGLGPVLWL